MHEEGVIYLHQEDVVSYLAELEEMLFLADREADPISLLALLQRQLGTRDTMPLQCDHGL